jgi:hypothetical protein
MKFCRFNFENSIHDGGELCLWIWLKLLNLISE